LYGAFRSEDTEWLGYPIVKNFEDMFIRFDKMHERDGHTHIQIDTQTPHDHIGCACIASRSENTINDLKYVSIEKIHTEQGEE